MLDQPTLFDLCYPRAFFFPIESGTDAPEETLG